MTKENIASFGQTFVATFLATLGLAVTSLPTDTLLDIKTYTTAFFASLFIGALRATVKFLWQKYLPVSVGGVRD